MDTKGTMKFSGRLILIAGIALFIFMLASLLMLSDALQNSDRFAELYTALLIFSAIGLFVLVALIALNLRSLVHQLRDKVPGARMTTRIVLFFSILSITPVLILYYFSLDFLQRGIDSWFVDLGIEETMDDSLELSRLAIDIRMKELSRQTEQIAEEFAGFNNVEMAFEIDDYRLRSGVEELTLMSRQGSIIAYALGDTDRDLPDLPSETILFQLQQGNNYIGLDTTRDEGLYIRSVVNLPNLGAGNETRILQALNPIANQINTLVNKLESKIGDYKELFFLHEKLKLYMIRILTLVLLFSIFSVVWAAFYLAQSLVAPIRNLAEGTKSVAEGDYTTQLPVPSHDELGYLVASFNDMTQKIGKARDDVRQSQQEVEAQRAYLEAVLSRLSSGVLVLDEDRKIRTANIRCGKILGLEIQSIIAKTLSEIGSDHDHMEQFSIAIESYLKRTSADWREQITLLNDNERQILMCTGTSLSLTEGSDLIHVIVFDDITALIQGQRDAAWSEMARRLAHEIKNPLTPIKLAAERLRHKYLNTLSDEQSEVLDKMTNTIVNQVETMKNMVNAFSDYARVPGISTEYVELNSLIQEVVDLYSNLDTEAEINMQLESGLPHIKADPSRLRQVFNNILNNAFDAASKQEQTILNIQTSLKSAKTTSYIETRIKDSGPGLSEDIISTIFEPYATTKKKGTGLGLAIVKKIIEEHGGSVQLENNQDGPGACAVIKLPVISEKIDEVITPKVGKAI